MSADVSRPDHPPDIPSHSLPVFFGLTFLISWSLIGSYILFPDATAGLFGEISATHPFFILATWAPAISAVALVLHHGGTAGLRGFLSRLRFWRIGWPWVLLVALGIPMVYMIGSAVKGGPLLAPIPPEGLGPMAATLLFMLILGPVEEFGWRGVAQPILQRHMAPLWAGALIGMVWGFWHLPVFYLSGMVFTEWHFLPFFIGNVTLAILVTPLFNAAKGGLIWPILFHWQLINPFWPDAQPFDTWILVAVTAVIVLVARREMLQRDRAATRVIPSD